MRANAAQARLAWRAEEPILTIPRQDTIALALTFTHRSGQIASYDVIADPDRLAALSHHLPTRPSASNATTKHPGES